MYLIPRPCIKKNNYFRKYKIKYCFKTNINKTLGGSFIFMSKCFRVGQSERWMLEQNYCYRVAALLSKITSVSVLSMILAAILAKALIIEPET